MRALQTLVGIWMGGGESACVGKESNQFKAMIRTITKLGSPRRVGMDCALMKLARLEVGDRVNVMIRDDGSIDLTPTGKSIDAKVAGRTAKRLMRRNSDLFRRLS